MTEAERGNDQKADTHKVGSRKMMEAFTNEVLAQKGKAMVENDADETVYVAETIITAIDVSIDWLGRWRE